jgi:hypothetical protein
MVKYEILVDNWNQLDDCAAKCVGYRDRDFGGYGSVFLKEHFSN